jgi:uncharacterized membrane protein
MDGINTAAPADFSVTAQPNCSLSPAQRRSFLILMYCVTFGIAIGFALTGIWMVLPFAGLEMLALTLAFSYIGCHAGDYERISIKGDCLTVETLSYKDAHRHEFNRYWAKVVLARHSHGCRVALRSHGREVEVGRFLTDEQRLALASQLKIQLGNK